GLPDELVALDAGAEELAGADLAGDRLVRHDAHAHPGLDHRLDDLDVLGVHYDGRLDFFGGKKLIDDFPRGRPDLEEHERLAVEVWRAQPWKSANGGPSRSAGATFRRLASGCVGVVTSSSSSCITGTVTKSDSWTGRGGRPASTRPPR